MKLTDKRFWIWTVVATILLAVFPLFFYGERPLSALLVLASCVIAVSVGLWRTVRQRPGLAWLYVWLMSVGFYIADVILIDQYRLIKMELYPLITGQIYLLPMFLGWSGIICLICGIIMSKVKSCRI